MTLLLFLLLNTADTTKPVIKITSQVTKADSSNSRACGSYVMRERKWKRLKRKKKLY